MSGGRPFAIPARYVPAQTLSNKKGKNRIRALRGETAKPKRNLAFSLRPHYLRKEGATHETALGDHDDMASVLTETTRYTSPETRQKATGNGGGFYLPRGNVHLLYFLLSRGASALFLARFVSFFARIPEKKENDR